MGSNKKDLEIIYNLQWKNGNGTGQNDKSNIVGMYDIPATTLNWETFKSYLLKNSGAVAGDVKVSYVSSDDKEFPIESQLDFQIALYSFRQRACNNDIITLKLERVTSVKPVVKRQRKYVEEAAPPADEVPEWFKNYMKGYKKEIVDEVTMCVVNTVSNMKPPGLGRKLKEASTKRLRKSGENNEKEMRKTLKLERKLEELEEKVVKGKDKKLIKKERRPFVISEDYVADYPIEVELLMNAAPLGVAEVTVPHISGGEVYRQEWPVANTGSIAWTIETELRYAWGSEALKPINKVVPCPLLLPGEEGSVVVFLDVPVVSGTYECYWHFSHKGRRFGHWLGVRMTVDASPIKWLSVHRFDPVDNSVVVEPPSAVSWSAQTEKPLNLTKESSETIANVTDTLLNLTLASSDTDNQSVISVADSNSSIHSSPSGEFVLVSNSGDTHISEPVDEKPGYAYINFDGKKQAVPKKFLRSDYLETAEEATGPDTEDKSRLFVFPLKYPGFEVVHPPNPMSDSLLATAGYSNMNSNVDDELHKWLNQEIQSSAENHLARTQENDKLEQLLDGFKFAEDSSSKIAPGNCHDIPPHSEMPNTIPYAPPADMFSNIPVPPPRSFSYPPGIYPPTTLNNFNPIKRERLPYSFNPVAKPFTPRAAWQPIPPYNGYTFTPYCDSYYQHFMHATRDRSTPLLQSGSCFETEDTSSMPTGVPVSNQHIIPDALVSGAVNVASSAINTARSVLNMFSPSPQPPVQPSPNTVPQQQSPQGTECEKAMQTLSDMGFWNRNLNISLLERFHGDVAQVVFELLK